MDRRRFLHLGLLTGVSCVLSAAPVAAFQQVDCAETGNADPACRRLNDHLDRIRQLDQALAAQGMTDPEQRRAVLAATLCPFCGLPLIATAGPGGF